MEIVHPNSDFKFNSCVNLYSIQGTVAGFVQYINAEAVVINRDFVAKIGAHTF